MKVYTKLVTFGMLNHFDNLEVITVRKNTNQKHLKHRCSSKYTGVYLHKKTGKWQAYIRINGKQKYLGLFKLEIDAYKEYCKALNNII